MPNLPLTSTEYPSIRAVLDVSLDSTVLPDATIALDVFQGAAEADVERQDPSWASRTGAEATAIQQAAIYYTAARIAPRYACPSGLRTGAQASWGSGRSNPYFFGAPRKAARESSQTW